ncbi:MAG: COG1361 family protein [Candidatus Methylomirabilia bacterium]
MHLTLRLMILTLALSAAPLFTPAARAFPVNQCASDRFGSNLGCTAGDVSISSIAIAAGGVPSCVGGQSLVFDLDVTINAANAKRYDIGVFLSNDGKSTRLTSANNGAATCSVGMVPKTPLPFKDWDTDACGDIDGPGSGTFQMNDVTVLCSAAGSTTGKLAIPFMVTWDVNAGSTCSSIADPIPTAQSKCNAPLVLQTVEVVVLPVITNADGTDFIKPGASTTYTVVITNNTGIALSSAGGNAAVFRDPAVANLTVSDVTCTAADGASCPAGLTVAGMQAGLTIPALPVGGSVTFSISADVDSGTSVGTLITNTASVAVYGQSNSASDTNTVTLTPPPTITITDGASVIIPGGSSTYTVVITNNTGTDFSTTAGNAAVFRDPATANLTINSITCSAAKGASCPAVSTVVGMQGAGLTIPTLPDHGNTHGSVTFSINATVNVGAPIGTVITNIASVTANGRTNFASDNTAVNYLVFASISATPSCLYSGSTATFTMKVTNWTGITISAVTPSALTGYVTGTAAIGAFTGPNPASIATLAHGVSGTFTWTATVTGGVNDAYSVAGYAASGGPRTLTATSNTQEINGYTIDVDPASTYANSTNQHLAWTIANFGCSMVTGNPTNIDRVAIAVPAGWTLSGGDYAVYALAANTLFDLVETWPPPSGTTFTAPNATDRIPFTGSGIFDLVFAATPAVPGTTDFTITITDDTGTPRTLLTTVGGGSVTVDPYNNSTPGQGNFTGSAAWQEQFR